MGSTWITDLTHFLTDDGSITTITGPARRLGEFLSKIVLRATRETMDESTNPIVKCRRRPGRKPCPGEIEINLDHESGEIYWRCPFCMDNGVIRNWQGSFWDCTGDGEAH